MTPDFKGVFEASSPKCFMNDSSQFQRQETPRSLPHPDAYLISLHSSRRSIEGQRSLNDPEAVSSYMLTQCPNNESVLLMCLALRKGSGGGPVISCQSEIWSHMNGNCKKKMAVEAIPGTVGNICCHGYKQPNELRGSCRAEL